ncbi:hypothetical protein [Actinomadura rubrisoli]|nr:hypothetical protein [Actinomadura rubrisoli]
MGKDEAKPDPCNTCRGQAGWWEYGNGQPDVAKPKRWIKCMDCNGKGHK